jgi:hypothetical protein
MSSPSAPEENLANPGRGTTPLTEPLPQKPSEETTPAGLLTSAGRTSNLPAGRHPLSPAALAPVSAAKTV